MADYVIKDETLTTIADAIRTKRETTDQIPTTSMAAEILAIETGSDPDPVEQATPSITVSSAGLITASATQEAGYVSAGTKSATQQLDTQAAQTITPGTSNKTIASGRYLTGTQTIKGDPNLIAENIKKGVSIFDVTGTHEGGAVVQKKTGAFTLDEYGEATVSCGFKPDCVAVYGGILNGDTVYPGAMFTEAGETVIKLIVPPPSTEYLFTVLPITQTSNGFSISEAVKLSAEYPGNTYWSETSRTFNYVAMKYT